MLCIKLNREILLVFIVFYVLTEIGIIFNTYFGNWYLKILKMQHRFQCHPLFKRDSKPSSLTVSF